MGYRPSQHAAIVKPPAARVYARQSVDARSFEAAQSPPHPLRLCSTPFYTSNKPLTQANPAQEAIEFIVLDKLCINPNPTTSFFVETDPQFTNYRQWLSSNYLLAALGLDPATTQNAWATGSMNKSSSASKWPC
jgi:hypothetical protein